MSEVAGKVVIQAPTNGKHEQLGALEYAVNWAVWTQSSFPGTTGPDCPVSPAGTANPFVYVSKVPMYSAFQVHDGGTCPH
jgi:hypothetical protein